LLPLAGTRVLDLTRLLPGPYATLVLADLGADVVKVEDPRGGDPLREVAPGPDGPAFQALNRNKRSLALDLRAPGGAEVLVRLARSADVLVESFRPGVLDRLGCGHERLRAASPRLVVCAITGYGQEGPYRDLAGHDLDYCAISGALALNGPAERPLPFGVPVADLAGGAWPAVAAILAALVRRATTGEGGVADVSMTDGALATLTLPLALAAARGVAPAREREPLNGGAPCYRVYRAKDGRFVALAALEDRFFARFCAAVGRPDLAARRGDPAAIPELDALFATRSRDEWAALGRDHDCCLAPVLEGEEPGEDPQLRARGAFAVVEARDGTRSRAIRSPVRLDGGLPPLRAAPALGEHSAAVLADAGFTADEIGRLRTSGVVGPGEP
jgi:crotonobetainyl-CoA:carnitine CoA-transferase CaiB-like acyl-CoA transferase